MAKTGELPRMGWFTSLHGFVALEDIDEVNIYAPVGFPSAGKRKAALSGQQITEIQGLDREVCDLQEKDRPISFDVGRATDAARAFYTRRPYEGGVRSGMVTVPLNAADMARVNRLLGWPGRDVLRRDEAIGVRRQSFYYSWHRLYDSSTGHLSREAIVLHAKDGQILWNQVMQDLDKEQVCDGCGIPTYADGGGEYVLLNMFELPGFSYPVLLLDTSTAEGRAISLATFTPKGIFSSVRAYEYVAQC